jgi:cytidylate kinase
MDAEKAIITIGREYGSGGREIGSLLAKSLGVPFYDKELLTRAARASGICEEMFESHDEKAVPSYLFTFFSGANAVAASGDTELPLNHRIFLAQFEAIAKIALEGPCVMVGRCANYVLKDQPNMVSIFMYASVEARVERIMQVENLTREQAKDRVRKVDKQRQGYYNFFADGNWGHRSNYHLMVNTTGVAYDAIVESIVAYISGRTV